MLIATSTSYTKLVSAQVLFGPKDNQYCNRTLVCSVPAVSEVAKAIDIDVSEVIEALSKIDPVHDSHSLSEQEHVGPISATAKYQDEPRTRWPLRTSTRDLSENLLKASWPTGKLPQFHVAYKDADGRLQHAFSEDADLLKRGHDVHMKLSLSLFLPLDAGKVFSVQYTIRALTLVRRKQPKFELIDSRQFITADNEDDVDLTQL